MTFLFREVLKVTSVGDRKDIFAKYNLLVDNYARNPGVYKKMSVDGDKDQIDADQIGVFALAAAGYDPQAIVAFWDRFAQTKGNKGNFFSDWFGTTSPESRRLREMFKNVGVLPTACVEARQAVTTAEFESWKTSVINYVGLGRKESLHGLISKTSLEPALRSVTGHIQFSPDGKYVLAQDDSGINVLTRDPFAVQFRIDAEGANPAQFTSDSKRVVFQTEGVRVQIWDISEQRLINAKDVLVRAPCLQTSLSPDGKQLACLNSPSYICKKMTPRAQKPGLRC